MSSTVGSKVGTSNGPFNLVGNPNVTRIDTLAKITGKKKFTSDIQPTDIGVSAASGFMYMGEVTCPHPHAMIKKIDTSKAEAAGFVTLTTADTDFLPPYTYYSTSGSRYRGPLAYPEVLFAGCPVAVVGATSPDLVNDAINLVDVEYEPLPYVFDAEEALAPSAPQLWPGGNSPTGTVTGSGVPAPLSTALIQVGDAATAIKEADATVTVRLDTQFCQHLNLENTATVVQWTAGDFINIWGNTAGPGMQSTIANYFMVPVANITQRVGLGGFSGGSLGSGFGNNDSLYEESVLAVALSKKSGMPVKLVMTKSGNSLASRTRWPHRAYLTLAAKNGLITAVQAVLYINAGAVSGAGSIGFGVDYYEDYTVPNLDITCYSANTDGMAQPAYQRDVGITQNCFFMETAVDMLAEKLNIDPATFRLNNLRTAAYTDPVTGTVYPDTAFNITNGTPYSGYGHPATFLKTTSEFNWSSRWKGWGVPSNTLTNSGETQGTGKKLRGVGISVNNGDPSRMSSFIGPNEGTISVSPSGVITVLTGGADQGGGLFTTMPIIAGELLGQTSLGGIVVSVGDSSLDPAGAADMSVASRSTGSMGMGLVMAARNLASQWFPVVAAKLAPGTQASNLTFGNDTIYDTTNPTNSMSFKAAAALLPSTITSIGTYMPPPRVSYALARTSCCEVEVDVETADVRVINYVGGVGAGQVIFAKGTDSQVTGSMAGMGLAMALYQEHINDSSTGLKYSGSYLSPNLLDQKTPTIMDAPDTATGVYDNYVDPIGPFGAIGYGQEVMSGVPAVIVNALSNAFTGYRAATGGFTKLPVRKEDIVTALQWMKANGKL